MQRQGKEVTCLARLVPHGIEIDIAHGGTVIVTRVFDTDAEALAWADEKRASRVSQGWTDVSIEPSRDRVS